jgi:hypothetical protein
MTIEEFEFIIQAEDVFKLAYKALKSFEKGLGQELSKFQKELYLLGFAGGITYDKFTEEEVDQADDLMDLYLYFMDKELSKQGK